MKLFWQKANTTIRWQLQVLNAVIRSKLLYGLECIQLTKAEISRRNAFQNQALRRIVGKPPTFLDRQATNETIYREIRNQHRCHFEHFGKSWKCAKIRLFGHVLRSPASDPMKQLSLAADAYVLEQHHVVARGVPERTGLRNPTETRMRSCFQLGTHVILAI